MTTPIVDFVRQYAQSGTARLHMPGHKGKAIPESALAGADYLGKKALLTCEIEKHKCRLDKLYRAIGERVAAGSLSEKASGEKEPIFRLIDEAASEKQKIAALSEARDKIVFCRGR